MDFTKMHGLGNDFIIIDAKDGVDYHALTRKMCTRRLSVGADGVLAVLPSRCADLRMRIFNADGSEAEMCGNGIRCIAKYAYETGRIRKAELTVETLAGIMKPRLTLENGRVVRVRVDMGSPDFSKENIPMTGGSGRVLDETVAVAGRKVGITAMLMGVPHAVVFTEGWTEADCKAIGPELGTHPMFPEKTNVDFVEVMDKNNIRIKTWERGAGFTLACGTGACASAVAAHIRNQTGRKVTVHTAVGELYIEYTEEGRVLMTGPVEEVFKGSVEY